MFEAIIQYLCVYFQLLLKKLMEMFLKKTDS